jgi:hypothetical protein
VTHIRLIEANPGKLEVLDQLIAVYLPLCQQYVLLLCTQESVSIGITLNTTPRSIWRNALGIKN